MTETFELKVQRQDNPGSEPFWQAFLITYRPNMNVISALQAIQRNPVTKDRKKVTPVVWDANCLEEVCGACSMIINGSVRQACSALVDKLDKPIVLSPMTKFPLIRDLWVDRSRMFAALKNVKAWIPIDGTYDLGSGPKMSEELREVSYEFSKCMTCGCCLEACPQYLVDNDFVGAFAIQQALLFNNHPTGEMNKGERLDAMMAPSGITGCGNAQNCVEACPKDLPLLDAIAKMQGDTLKHGIKRFFRGKG